MESLPRVNYRADAPPIQGQPIILITNTHVDFNQLNSKFQCEFGQIKLIIHPNSGYDNIPLELAKKKQLPIILGNPIRANAVATYIASCILEYFTPIPVQHYWNHSRRWERNLLRDQNLLLIGHGQIGRLVEQIFAPLVKEIFIYDPYKGHYKLPIAQGNIVVLAAGLNPSSFHLVDGDFSFSTSRRFSTG